MITSLHGKKDIRSSLVGGEIRQWSYEKGFMFERKVQSASNGHPTFEQVWWYLRGTCKFPQTKIKLLQFIGNDFKNILTNEEYDLFKVFCNCLY